MIFQFAYVIVGVFVGIAVYKSLDQCGLDRGTRALAAVVLGSLWLPIAPFAIGMVICDAPSLWNDCKGRMNRPAGR